MPHGWSTFAPGQIGVSDRQHNVIENEDDLRVWFNEATDASVSRPLTVCGYCTDRCRARTLKSALGWFHEHECSAPFARQAERRTAELAA